jgi:hypothetical protein
MNRLSLLALGLLLSFAPSSQATVSFYALKDSYDVDPANPQIYRFDGVSNFRSSTQAAITTRVTAQGRSSDIAIDEQGRFYFVNGDPSQTNGKGIWRWNSLADWASNNGATLLGTRSSTAQISGFSVYQNEFYFLEGDPNGSGNKTLKKWASAASWGNGDAGTTLGTRGTGTGLGFEIDAGGAVWFLDGSNQTSTAGTLFRWSSINNFLNNTGGIDNGGTFTFSFSGSSDQIGGLAVPEPSSSLLLLTSLATLSLFRRRSS